MRHTPKRTLTALLRAITFLHVFGERLPIGIRPSCNKVEFQHRYNAGRFTRHLKNEDFSEHFLGQRTLYFFGTPRISDEYTLVMIDIDVLKALGLGSTAGAISFAEHLKSIWPNLYYERSTNGKGIHAYILVRKCQVGAEAVNESLDRLAAFLRHQADITNADIELVEVKGYCPIIKYDYKGNIVNVTYGTFAKYPRHASLQQLQNTTVIDWQDLRREQYSVPDKPARLNTGSGCKSMPKDYTEQLPDLINHFSKLTAGHKLVASDGRQVTNEDGGIVLLIAKYLSEHPNKEHRHSLRYCMLLWRWLHDEGACTRCPNHKIFAAVRNHLSSRGLINWIDNRYQPSSKPEAKDGVCCRWALMESFLSLLEQGGDNVDNQTRGNGKYLFPELRMLREQANNDWQTWAEDQIEELFRIAA